MSKEARKDALKVVAGEVRLMLDEDIARVMKLCKAELKARHALDNITGELDSEAAE